MIQAWEDSLEGDDRKDGIQNRELLSKRQFETSTDKFYEEQGQYCGFEFACQIEELWQFVHGKIYGAVEVSVIELES